MSHEFAARLGPAVGAMTGRRTEASTRSEGTPSTHPQDLLWKQALDAAPDAHIWLYIPAALTAIVGKLVLSAAGVEEFEEADVENTFLEILQQTIAPLCSAMSAKLGREVTLSRGERAIELPSQQIWRQIDVSVEDSAPTTVWITGNSALLGVLEIVEPSRSVSPEPQEVASARAVAAARSSRTLDLLMEVELPVGVSFGRAQMRLKDAIKLTTGSIVELNRSIVEPVEIIVNNCVIARGEVVVVEGNYGVRIREIISREERLRTLF
ncbi:MAG: flagellar motor switch protein FliN [Fimbriimonadaceae bacterium]|nr:flagellar motor switch protein FliN [Fimbriimonadaceae bacterium]